MMMQLIYIALKYLNYHKRASFVALTGVAIGVGFFIGLAALLQGLQIYFTQQVIDNSPHIIIQDAYRKASEQPITTVDNTIQAEIVSLKPVNDARGIRGSTKLLNNLEQHENLSASPVLIGEVFLKYGSQDLSAVLLGIIPAREDNISNLSRQLLDDVQLRSLYLVANGIILGAGLANKIGAKKGDSLIAVSAKGIQMQVQVVGIFQSGISSQDDNQAFMLLNKVQVLMGMKNVINQIRIRISEDIAKAQTIASKIEKSFGYKTQSWQELNQNIFRVFVIQNSVMYACIAALLIIALFSMYNIISTIVNEKKRDIAILKSIGFLPRDIKMIFLWQGILIGVLGALIGWLIGYSIIQLLLSIRFENKGFSQSNGFVLNESFMNYVISFFMALMASMIAAYIPAKKAANVLPVNIIRGES